MKTICYKERAKFYSDEICENEKEHFFLKKLIDKYKIKSVLEVPCGSGFNLEFLSHNCENVFMLDKEGAMIKEVQNRIQEKSIKNCRSEVGDIMRYKIDIKPELTYIPHQALQLFSNEELETVISNVMLNTEKYLLFDVYNYYGTGEIGMCPNYLLEGTTSFEFSGIPYVREGKIVKYKDFLDLIFCYSNLNDRCTTVVTLYQYSVEYIVRALSKYKFNYMKVFSDYDFNLWGGEKSALFLVCK